MVRPENSGLLQKFGRNPTILSGCNGAEYPYAVMQVCLQVMDVGKMFTILMALSFSGKMRFGKMVRTLSVGSTKKWEAQVAGSPWTVGHRRMATVGASRLPGTFQKARAFLATTPWPISIIQKRATEEIPRSDEIYLRF